MPAGDLDLYLQSSLTCKTGSPQLHDGVEPSQSEDTEAEEERGPWKEQCSIHFLSLELST